MSSKVKNFTLDVIDFFLSIPESIVKGFDRKEFYRFLSGYNTDKALTCGNIAHFISNLKRSGYVKIENIDGRESIKFTNKARLAIVDKVGARSVSDNKHRFISFDIPERLRLNRDQFRRTIKRLGFRQIQKSLWVVDKNIGDMVELAALEYEVSDYVVYIVSDKTNIDNTIDNIILKK